MTEQEIIEGIKRKSERAFRELVQQHQDRVVNVCNSFLHNRHDALDVSQEVFIEVYKSAHKFRGDAKLATWLYRIASNRSLNFIRSQKRKKWLSYFDLLFESPPADQKLEADYELENEERKQALKYALDSLPEKQRAVFTLSQYEKLSYHEISEILSISNSNVGVLISRAKKSLQKKILEFYQKN